MLPYQKDRLMRLIAETPASILTWNWIISSAIEGFFQRSGQNLDNFRRISWITVNSGLSDGFMIAPHVLKHVIFKEYVVQKNTKTENYIVSELPLPTAEVKLMRFLNPRLSLKHANPKGSVITNSSSGKPQATCTKVLQLVIIHSIYLKHILSNINPTHIVKQQTSPKVCFF